jgi:DDE superfamily endonuclease
MVVPYSGKRLPEDKDTANYYISLARQTIERAFGVLVSRFGILHRALTCRARRVPKLMGALVRLHNLCVHLRVPDNLDFRPGDLPIFTPQDDCANEAQGRRRDLEISLPRQKISEYLVERGMVRPPHSSWGRNN